ncbi:PREDICTED: NDR1/HIN1-like protein 12 [Nelumbo nucifera]|uniref:NDR1/HIN1-like protein 12 n=1 Tax=Nelumbo nucifera TaxID=4432 RepID=A0A1U7ZRN4_NELNU|nr:PREDICTED: NDR1/HIN1-like protein 12 [Nelumbo nucifera]
MTEGGSKGGGMVSRYAPSDARRFACTFIVVFLILAGVTALIVWLVYRPHKPHFTVVGAAIYDLNMTSSTIMSTTMQFTIVTRNPNKRVSIYYDRLSAYVSYRNQAITPPAMLPPLFQETRSTVALSPMMGGPVVPVSMEVANGLVMDEAYGVVPLRLVVLGRLRWKAGAFKSGHYGIYVKCDMLVGLKKGFVGQAPLLGSPDCNVDI